MKVTKAMGEKCNCICHTFDLPIKGDPTHHCCTKSLPNQEPKARGEKSADNRWDVYGNRPGVKIYLHFEDGKWTWCNDRQEPDDIEYIDVKEVL